MPNSMLTYLQYIQYLVHYYVSPMRHPYVKHCTSAFLLFLYFCMALLFLGLYGWMFTVYLACYRMFQDKAAAGYAQGAVVYQYQPAVQMQQPPGYPPAQLQQQSSHAGPAPPAYRQPPPGYYEMKH